VILLVAQVPCIEHNTMGTIKAINNAEIDLESYSLNTKVSLDKVISRIKETAKI